MSDFTTQRLNFEVVLYKGCTLNEIVKIGIASTLFCVLMFTPITLIFFRSFLWGLVPGFLLSPLVALILIVRLQMLKRDKPHGYYQHYLQLKLARWGWRCPYVQRSGKWSVGRPL